MKKSILYSIIAVMMFIFICMICFWEVHLYETRMDAEPQKVTKTFEYGDLIMVVETDRTFYEFYDYVYVTATLRNCSQTTTYTFSTPTSVRGVHRELDVQVCQGKIQMLDVDTYIMEYPLDGGTFTLAPNEQHVQVMRFSTALFNNQVGDVVFINSNANYSSGIYQGTVTANLLIDGEVKPLSVEFQVEMGEETVFSSN